MLYVKYQLYNIIIRYLSNDGVNKQMYTYNLNT